MDMYYSEKARMKINESLVVGVGGGLYFDGFLRAKGVGFLLELWFGLRVQLLKLVDHFGVLFVLKVREVKEMGYFVDEVRIVRQIPEVWVFEAVERLESVFAVVSQYLRNDVDELILWLILL